MGWKQKVERLDDNLERVEAQLREWRGQVERQNYEISALRRRISDLEIAAMPEFDRLLAKLEQAKSENEATRSADSIIALGKARTALRAYCERNGCKEPEGLGET